MNKTIITGRLTADPELRTTKGGEPISVTSFIVAVSRRFQKDGKDQSDFIDAVAWRHHAEFICNYFTKGKRIELCGELQTRTRVNKNGDKFKVTELIVDEVGFGGDKAKEDGGKQQAPSNPPINPQAKTAQSQTMTPPDDFEPDFSDPNTMAGWEDIEA